MRLPWALPDFCRHTWASADTQVTWAPRLEAIGEAWAQIERETVARGDRAVALQAIPTDDLSTLIEQMKARGLTVLPLGRIKRANAYATETQPASAHEPAYQHVAILRHADAARWLSAWQTRQDDAIGALLGYPACCRAFYLTTWKCGSIDPTFEAAQATLTASRDGDAIALPGGHGAANLLHRWMGVRAVPHLPCAFDCEATMDFGARFRSAAVALGLDEPWVWIEMILGWPVHWSSLHGIAEIVSPVWRVTARSDAWTERRSVTVDGAAAGTGRPEDVWTLNGFRSLRSMREAHDVVADAVRQAWLAPHSVLDLGCGNGLLARRLAPVRFGLDLNAAALAQAQRLDPGGRYGRGDVLRPNEWHEAEAVLTLLMAGRLLEASPAQRAELAAALEGRMAVLYLYGDWMAKTTVEAAMRAAGLTFDDRAPVVHAARQDTAEASLGILRRVA